MLRDLANGSDCGSGGWDHRNNRMAVGRSGNLERYTAIRENEKHAISLSPLSHAVFLCWKQCLDAAKECHVGHEAIWDPCTEV